MKPHEAKYRNRVLCLECKRIGLPQNMLGKGSRAYMKETRDARYGFYVVDTCRNCINQFINAEIEKDQSMFGSYRIDLKQMLRENRKRHRSIMHGKSYRLRKKLMWKHTLLIAQNERNFRKAHGFPLRKPTF